MGPAAIRNHPPDSVRSVVDARRAPDDSVLLWQPVDIEPGGTFGEQWLVITGTRLFVIAPNGGEPHCSLDVPLDELKNVATVQRVGSVSLEAELNGTKIELARSSNAFSGEFNLISRGLSTREKDGGAPVFNFDDEEPRHCPKCGRYLPEKGSFCPACFKRRRVIQRLWGYMKPHWPKAVIIALFVSLSAIASVAPPYLTKVLVDDVLTKSGNERLLLPIVLALAGLFVIARGFTIVQGRIAAKLGSHIMHDVRFDLYQSIQALTFRRFDKVQVGTLMSRLLTDTERVNYMMIDLGAWFAPMVLQLIAILIMLFSMDWFLALFMLLPVPVFFVLFSKFHRFIHKLFHRHWIRRDRMSAVANDSLSGLRVVKAFAQEPREISKFGTQSIGVYHAMTQQEQAFATWWPMLDMIVTSGQFLVWYVGGRLVLGAFGWHPQVTLGTLMAFIAYMGMFYQPLGWISQIGNHVNQAITAAQRLFEIIDADREAYDDPDAAELDHMQGHIEFRDVRFGYRTDREIIKGVSFDVQPGEMIGLVGRSGVGKSTITNLICRFYDVNEGAILVDGTDIKKVQLTALRKQIGIVPQESYLFDGTIAENIAFAKPDATREEIIRAAIAANAHGFIVRQPDGYDTRVGERGGRLSGGEKQRIAIARAILHDPKILILDEATSSVDTETEDLIQTALRRLVKGRTTFAIAHRLSTLRYANRLVVIDDGKVAEIGSHDELMAKGGTYSRLVEMQSKLSSIKAVDG